MIGGAQQPDAGTKVEDSQERMRGFLNMVQQIHSMVQDTASQHPESAAGARKVQEEIERWIMSVVKSPGGTSAQPPSPRIVG